MKGAGQAWPARFVTGRPPVIHTFDVGEDGRVSSVRIKQEGTGVDRLKTRKPE